jgi:hypothetical protein
MNVFTRSSYTAQAISDGTIFHFDYYEEFVNEVDNTNGEEFTITCNDGGSIAELFHEFRIDQSDLEAWFDADVDSLVEHEKAAYYYLAGAGFDINGAVERLDDVMIRAGMLLDAATEFFDDVYLDSIPALMQNYIDYEKFAWDCQLGGDMYEFEYAGNTWTCLNSNDI